MISSKHPNLPYILSLTEYHLKQMGLEHIHIENNNLGAKYCRQILKEGRVNNFIHKNLKFTNLNLEDYCKDQLIEACALKLEPTFLNFCVLTIYQAPSGNSDQFLNQLETILNVLHSQKIEFFTCGDINVNYLPESNIKQNLDSLLLF